MSALQKIESGYNILIRLLTVIITLALLVGACFVTVNWLHATATAPAAMTPAAMTPKVSATDLVTHLVTPEALSTISANDPNYASYERIRKAVGEFAKKHEVADEDVGMDDVLKKVKFVAEGEDTMELTQAYVAGAADALEHALVDPKVDALLAKSAKATQEDTDESSDAVISKPMDVVGSVLDGFMGEFDRQVAASTDGKVRKGLAQEKLDSWATLAKIGVPIGLLVLLLQLLTFGKLAQSVDASNRAIRRNCN
jgi:hypothetical protein